MLNDFYHSLDPIAFTIGSFSVRWYGLAYLFGFICAGFIIYAVSKHWKLGFLAEDVLTFILCDAFGLILGARLGYCLFYGAGEYIKHPLEIFMLSNGGMSFHGGLVGVVLGAFVASKIMHTPFLTLVDLGSIAAPVGIFFGRCANFVNGELWGSPTDLPWGVVFDTTGGGLVARHPSQLYEAILEGLVILAVLLILSRRTPARPRGTFFGMFLLLYGVFRILIEFVRLPDVQLGYLLGTNWLTMGMCLSIPVLLGGVAMLVYAHRTHHPQEGRRMTAQEDSDGKAA